MVSSSCFVDNVVVVAAAEQSWPSEHWLAVICCLTLQKDRVDQTDYVESFHVRILYYIPHSAAVFVFWKRHLHTSYRVIACRTHQPEKILVKISSHYKQEQIKIVGSYT